MRLLASLAKEVTPGKRLSLHVDALLEDVIKMPKPKKGKAVKPISLQAFKARQQQNNEGETRHARTA